MPFFCDPREIRWIATLNCYLPANSSKSDYMDWICFLLHAPFFYRITHVAILVGSQRGEKSPAFAPCSQQAPFPREITFDKCIKVKPRGENSKIQFSLQWNMDVICARREIIMWKFFVFPWRRTARLTASSRRKFQRKWIFIDWYGRMCK